MLDEDSEEEETLNSIRDYASDLFFNSYFVGGLLKGEESKEYYNKILLEYFVQGERSDTEYIRGIEVTLFAARSCIDALEIPEDTLAKVVWESLLQVKDIKEPTLFHSALGFINEASVYLEYDNTFLSESLKYIIEGFGLYYKIPQIQGSLFRCLLEICQNSPKSFNEETFELLLSFIEENAALISKSNCSNAIEAICSICSIIEDSKVPQVMHRILKTATDIFPNLEFSDLNHKIVFIKSLQMLCGAIKVLSLLSAGVTRETLIPILDEFLLKIGEALQHYNEDNEIVVCICNFYINCIKTLGQEFTNYFTQVSKDCFTCFNTSPQNTGCIDVCNLAISLIGGTSEVREFLNTNFSDLASCILQKLSNDKDPDLVKSFASFCYITSKKFSTSPIVNCPCFHEIITLFSEFMATNMDNDANKDIIFFLNELICNSDVDRENSRIPLDKQYIEYTGTALILTIPGLKSMVSQTFGKILTHMFKEYPDVMSQCVLTAFEDPKFNSVSPKIKQVFLKLLSGFRNNPKEFKLTIMEFHSIVRGIATDDVFLARELKLHQMQKENEIIQLD